MIALEGLLNGRVVAQRSVARALVVALLADGHILLQGSPGLAKTRLVTFLAAAIEGSFHRITFGPGKFSTELTGASVDAGTFEEGPHRQGQIFANILLVEGIDRASADARLALLDAMAERYVSVNGEVANLPCVFFVCATQTTMADQSAREALEPAELDRFLLQVRLEYPDEAAERSMLAMVRREEAHQPSPRPDLAGGAKIPLIVVLAARALVRKVRLGPRMQRRITSLVAATRVAAPIGNGPPHWIARGAGPRASIALDRCARAHAWLSGRRCVVERDVVAVAHAVLRHRIQLSHRAEEAEVTADAVIDRLLNAARAT